MKLRVSCLTVLASIGLWLPLRAATDPIDFLPEDTNAYFSYTKAKDGPPLQEHPVYKAFTNPALKKAFAPLLSQMAEGEERATKIWKEETGLTPEQVQALMNGTVSIGLRLPVSEMIDAVQKNQGKGAEAESPFAYFDVIGAAHFSGDEALAEKVMGTYVRITKEANAEAIRKLPGTTKLPDLEPSVEEYDGVKLHLWKPKAGEVSVLQDAGWAYLDKMVVFATSEKALRASIDLAKKGGATLAKAPRFSPIFERARNSNVIYYLDLQTTVVALVKKLVTERGGQVQPGEFDPAAIVTALGIEKFDSASLVADFKDGGVNAEMALQYHDKPALMSILAIDGAGTVPEFLPANAASGSYGTIYPDRMMTALENILKEAYPPGFAAFSTQLDTMKQKTGVDLKKDLLGNLGPDFWTATGDLSVPGKLSGKLDDNGAAAVPTQPQVFGLRVKDKKAFELALSSLINFAAPDRALFDEREYRGFSIRSIKGAPMPIGYVLSDDWLVFNVGPETLLEDVLGRLKSPSGEHLFGLSKIKDALSSFPAGEDSTSYLDFGNLIETMATLLRRLPTVEALKPIVDLTALPENLHLNLMVLSRVYLEENGYRVHLRLQEKTK